MFGSSTTRSKEALMYPKFDLRLAANGSGARVSGRLVDEGKELDPDINEVIVFAFVTQQPQNGAPQSEDEDAQGVTVRGETKLYRDEDPTGEARHLLGAGTWEFAHNTEGGNFDHGWAFGTAVQITVRDSGAIETYSWSDWVYLNFEMGADLSPR
jgi:hypothetical protein